MTRSSGAGAHRLRVALRGVIVAISLAGCITLAACQRGATVDRAAVTDEDTPARLATLVGQLMPRLERLSGLDRTEPVRVREQTRAEVRRYVEERLAEEMSPEELNGVHATYALLGLIPDTLDLRALLLDLYTEQVVGYYDPRRGTLYVVDDAPTDALRPVVVHELVHALQDQHTNLDSLIASERGNDRRTAAHAAMEGHAMIVMFASLAEEATRQEVDPVSLPSPARELAPALAAQGEQFPVFGRAPAIVRETLVFPYIAGSDFVHTLWQQRGRRDGASYRAPLDSLMPQSTRQVLEPAASFIARRVEPVELRFEDAPGTGQTYENTLGQLETSIFLAHHLGDAARQSASGLTGDRYFVIYDGDGASMIWLSLWDTEALAHRFAEAVRSMTGRTGRRRVRVEEMQLDGHAAVRVLDLPAADSAYAERLLATRVQIVKSQ